jgi:hypothetical protein
VHGSTLPLAEPLAAAFEPAVKAKFLGYGVTGTRPVAFVDPWPGSLLRPTDQYPVTRIAVRPEPHSADGSPSPVPHSPGGRNCRVLADGSYARASAAVAAEIAGANTPDAVLEMLLSR